MKKSIQFSLVLTVAFLFAALTSPLSAQVKAAPPELKAAMTALTTNWQAAYNREDANALAAMYADKVAVVDPNGISTSVTKEEIKTDLSNDFIEQDERIEIVLGSAFQRPDGTVRITGTFATTEVETSTGATIKSSGIFDHVVTKVAGVWKLTQVEVTPNN